jgi:hypothetical protein
VKRPWIPTPGGLFALAGALAAAAPSVRAAEWSWAPTFTLWLDHDSNRYLEPGGVPSEGGAVSLDLQLKYATERFMLTLHPQGQLVRYDEPEYQGANDASLAGAATYATGRSTLGLNTTLSESSLLTTELPVIGIVERGTRRREEDAGASWTYAQSETYALTLQAGYVDAAFQNSVPQPEQTTLENYHGLTASATEQAQYTETLALFGTFSAATYAEEGLAADSRTEGFVVGFKSQFSERITLSADAGANRTSFLSLTSSGLLADLSLSRTTETGSLSLSASRTVAPVGFAQITQQDSLKIAAQRNLTARLSVGASVSANRYSSVFSIPGLVTVDLPYLDRTYAQATLGLNWQQTETWTVGLQAATSRVQGQTVSSTEDWDVQVHMVWSPRAQSISR